VNTPNRPKPMAAEAAVENVDRRQFAKKVGLLAAGTLAATALPVQADQDALLPGHNSWQSATARVGATSQVISNLNNRLSDLDAVVIDVPEPDRPQLLDALTELDLQATETLDISSQMRRRLIP